MSEKYNPIVRTFNIFRCEVVRATGVPRNLIHPFTSLEILLPLEEREAVWKAVKKKLPHLPDLGVDYGDAERFAFPVLALAASLACVLGRWALLPLGFSVVRAMFSTSKRTLVLPFKTVGHAVLFATSFREHKASGHRWTKKEVSAKVRLIIASNLGVSFDDLKPNTTFSEIGVD